MLTDIDRRQDLGEIGVLADLDAMGERELEDALGDGAPAAGDDAGNFVVLPIVVQRHGSGRAVGRRARRRQG